MAAQHADSHEYLMGLECFLSTCEKNQPTNQLNKNQQKAPTPDCYGWT